MKAETRRAIDEAVARAIAAKDGEIAAAIADGLRIYGDRPAGEKGAPSLQYGIVDDVFEDDGYAQVTLDGQTSPVPINMLGGLTEGERVAVLLVPPSGNLAIGMVQPTVQPGGTLTALFDSYLDGTGTSVAASTPTYLGWVANPDAGTTWPANAGLLTPGTYGGNIGAEVIADGFYDFQMAVAGGTNGGCLVAAVLLRPGTGEALALDADSWRSVTGDGTELGGNVHIAHACLAGDVIYVRVTPTAGSTTSTYKLSAGVNLVSVA